MKVFSQVFFKKLAGSQGGALRRPPQRAKPFIVRQTQERVNFFAKQRKRENPRRGFSFFSWCLYVGEEKLLSRSFLPPRKKTYSNSVEKIGKK